MKQIFKKPLRISIMMIIILFCNLSVFSYVYLASKEKGDTVYNFHNYKYDVFVSNASDLSRRNIENCYDHYLAIAFSDQKEGAKYYERLNIFKQNLILFDKVQRGKTSFEMGIPGVDAKVLEYLETNVVASLQKHYKLNDADIQRWKDDVRLLRSSEEFTSYMQGESKTKFSLPETTWLMLQETAAQTSYNYRYLVEHISAKTQNFERDKQSVINDHLESLSQAKQLIIIFTILQAILFIFVHYYDHEHNNVSLLKRSKRLAFYSSTLIFFLFIPVTAKIYINEFEMEKKAAVEHRARVATKEIFHSRQNLMRVMNVSRHIMNAQYAYFLNQDRWDSAIGHINYCYVKGVQVFLKVLTSKDVATGEDLDINKVDDFKHIKTLINGSFDDKINLQTINWEVPLLYKDLEVLSVLWTEQLVKNYELIMEQDRSLADLSSQNLFLLVFLSLFEIFGTFLFLFYSNPFDPESNG